MTMDQIAALLIIAGRESELPEVGRKFEARERRANRLLADPSTPPDVRARLRREGW